MATKYGKNSNTDTRTATARKTEDARIASKQAQAAPSRPASAPAQGAGRPNLQQKIAERAFVLFKKRGCVHGHHQKDWLEAEAQIKRELKNS